MASRPSLARRCSFESLESRRLLAGDVIAKISGGDLIIKGDSLDNGITIAAGATAGTVVVTGVDAGGSATNVNGTSNGAVTLSGFTGDLKIDMKGGNDNVSITGLTVSDDAKLKVGSGSDTLSLSDSTIDGKLTTNLGAGNDTLTLDSTTVDGKARIKGRSGDDTATITDSTFTKLHLSLGKGNDSLNISGTTVSDSTYLNGRSGTNTFTNGTGNTLTDLTIKHFNETTAAELVSLNAPSAISENGTATLTGSFNDSDTTDSHTLTINWGDPNNNTNSTFAVPATSSLTAGQTITSTTDSTVLTISSIAQGQVNFSAQHLYLNDGAGTGNLMTSDDSTITVTVTGGANFNGSKTTTVTVNNVGPTVSLNTVAAVGENKSATVAGSFTDPGLLDGHSVVVNWGDPNNSAQSTFTVPAIQNAAGTAALTVNQTINSPTDGAVLTITSIDMSTGQVGFSTQHQYLDDGVAVGNGKSSDDSTISVSATDLDGQSGANVTQVTVNDVAPTVTLDQVADINVNGTATLTGTITDTGLLDEHPLLVQWGDSAAPQFEIPAIRNAAGTATLTLNQVINSTDNSATLTITSINGTTGQIGFSTQHQYMAAGTDIGIGVTVLDDDTLTGSATTSITVNATG